MAYRNLKQALERQRARLEQDQQALKDELLRCEQILARKAEVEAELRQVAQMLADLDERRERDVLRRIQVASPCTASWEEMLGDDRVRFCNKCSKHVYNLSSMTSDEARAVVHETEGELCARFFRRADGTVLTSDCPEGARRRRRRRLTLYAAAVTAVTAACTGAAQLAASSVESPGVSMGKVIEIRSI
jgi:hypothetical protein